jgi:amino acid transporter
MSAQPEVPEEVEGRRRLPRVLGLFDVGVLASAAMGPAYSLASTMGPMVAAAGEQATLALALLGLIMLAVAMSFARLSDVLPDAGSSFSWSARAFGPAGGTYAAWLLLLSNYFATMTTALPAATYTLALVAPSHATDPVWDAVVGGLWIVASTVLLYYGLRPTALVTALFLIGELVVLAVAAVASFIVAPGAEHVAATNAVALPKVGLGGIVAAMVLGIWMTDGWEVSASASEESTGPAETSGRGGIIALIVTTAILLAAMAAFLHVGTVAGFTAHQSDAMAYVAARLGGGAWGIAIDATVLVSTAATLWTTILYLSRSVYAMGRDGVLPRPIGVLDERGVPVNSLMVVFACVGGFTLLTGFWPSANDILNLVLNGTAVFLGALFCMSTLSAIKLLAGRPGETPFQAYVIPGFAAIALLAIVGVDIAESEAKTRIVELVGLALGIPFSVWRGRSMHLAKIFVGGRAPELEG